MSLTKRIAGNTVTQLAGKAGGTLVALITVGVLTRYLGREGYGNFTTVLTFLQFFGILADFGLSLAMTKLISEEGAREDDIASTIFTIRFWSGCVLFGLAPVLALAFPYSPAVKLGIAVGTFSYFAMALSQVLVGVFQKKLAMRYAAIAEVAGRVAMLAVTVAAAMLGWGVLGAVFALVASNVIQLFITLLTARRLIALRLKTDTAIVKRVFHESWPIALSIAFNFVYLKSDVLLLSLTRSQAEVGVYGAAYKVIDVITVIPTVFMGIVLPVFTKSWTSGDRPDFKRKLDRAFDVMSSIAIPLAVGTLAVGTEVMRLVAGDAFSISGTYLSILMIAGAMVFWSALFGHLVVATGQQKFAIGWYAADAVVSLALYVLFIPHYGPIAAAWVTVFSETFMAIATSIAVLSIIKMRPRLTILAQAAFASLIMYAVVMVSAPLHVLIRIALGMITYAFVLSLVGGIDDDLKRTFIPARFPLWHSKS